MDFPLIIALGIMIPLAIWFWYTFATKKRFRNMIFLILFIGIVAIRLIGIISGF